MLLASIEAHADFLLASRLTSNITSLSEPYKQFFQVPLTHVMKFQSTSIKTHACMLSASCLSLKFIWVSLADAEDPGKKRPRSEAGEPIVYHTKLTLSRTTRKEKVDP